MSGPPPGWTAAARALKARHGSLLAGDPSSRETTEQLAALDALDAARARLRGDEQTMRREAGQLMFRDV